MLRIAVPPPLKLASRGARFFACVALLFLLVRVSVADEAIRFVREGIVVSTAGDMSIHDSADAAVSVQQTLAFDEGPAERRMIFFDWLPLIDYRFQIGDEPQITLRSPQAPAPYLVRTIPLEDASAAASAGAGAATGSPPDSIVRFSPDNRRLAIGTLAGHLRVVDIFTGRLLHHERITEGQIKQLAWSPDGRQLYVGEQSPDAFLFALTAPEDPAAEGAFTLAWSVRLADQIETSRLPAGDRYGVYSLPAVHDLKVADDGRLFVVGLHSWSQSNRATVRSQVFSFAENGAELWRFPAERPLPLTIAHAAIDAAGTKVAFLANRPLTLHDGIRGLGDDLFVLDATTGKVTVQHRLKPLEPHFDRVEAWDSVALSADGTRLALGLADGRGLIFSLNGDELEPLKTLELSTPILVGGIPVAAACSYTRCFGDTIYFETQNTHIPFGNPQAANQAPAPHRGANTLSAFDLDGNLRWRYRGPFALSGVWSSRGSDGKASRWLMATCRELPGAREPGQFGFLLFDLARPGGGSDKLVYYYATDGPVIFSADISADGRWIAVTEVPAPTLDGFDLYGTHQVHVVH